MPTQNKILDASRKAGITYLDSYEKAASVLADGIETAGRASKIDWFAKVAATQAKATREVSKAYTASARELVG